MNKAFDSISLYFIHKVLRMFGFGEYIIQLVKILNTNFKAVVLQSGFLSTHLSVERGFRQGPPYLFLLCTKILSTLINFNYYNDMKGLAVHYKGFKIRQSKILSFNCYNLDYII